MSRTTLILNGTGVNYSWHFAFLSKFSFQNQEQYENVYLISGGVTAYTVIYSKHLGLITAPREKFERWSETVGKHYGNNIPNGLWRFAKMFAGNKKPFITYENYLGSYREAAHSDFFKLKLKDLPKNTIIPLYNFDKDRIDEASPTSAYKDVLLYEVIFAATAIPKIFPEIKICGNRVGDVIYCKQFLPWLKKVEKKSSYFENHNLIKDKEYDNGKYIKICHHKDGKKSVKNDNLRFMLGLNLPDFKKNVKKSIL